jgi:hypothetical protein
VALVTRWPAWVPLQVPPVQALPDQALPDQDRAVHMAADQVAVSRTRTGNLVNVAAFTSSSGSVGSPHGPPTTSDSYSTVS